MSVAEAIPFTKLYPLSLPGIESIVDVDVANIAFIFVAIFNSLYLTINNRGHY
jgi:hypothetical protein